MPDTVKTVAVKALEWVPVTEGGRDIQSVTEFGTYTISVDSPLAGWKHYLWVPGQFEYDEHHSEHSRMTSAKAAAQADYDALLKECQP